jgi:hypothetical protein
MNWKKATKIFILSTCVVWIVYDVFALIFGTKAGESATISAVIMGWAFKCPLAPCVWGGLAGHFFLPSKRVMSLWRAIVLAVWVIGVSIAGTVLLTHGGAWKVVFNPFVVMACFVPIGMIFFPQTKEV